MNIGWGTKIAILYTGFVVLIVSLVAASAMSKTDLVADDYYQQEVDFQKRLDAAQAGNALSTPLSIDTADGNVSILFPQEFHGKALSGTVHFYAAASSGADKIFPLKTSEGRYIVVRSSLAKMPYEVQVSWSASGKDYYQSIPLNLR